MDSVGGFLSSYERELWLLGLTSVVLLIASAALLPFVIARLPADFFVRRPRPDDRAPRSALRLAAKIARNAAGAALLAAGIVMLFLPGQGVLTMLVGLALIDLPGLRMLERRLILRPPVLRAANRIREWAGREPFVDPGAERD